MYNNFTERLQKVLLNFNIDKKKIHAHLNKYKKYQDAMDPKVNSLIPKEFVMILKYGENQNRYYNNMAEVIIPKMKLKLDEEKDGVQIYIGTLDNRFEVMLLDAGVDKFLLCKEWEKDKLANYLEFIRSRYKIKALRNEKYLKFMTKKFMEKYPKDEDHLDNPRNLMYDGWMILYDKSLESKDNKLNSYTEEQKYIKEFIMSSATKKSVISTQKPSVLEKEETCEYDYEGFKIIVILINNKDVKSIYCKPEDAEKILRSIK